MTDWIHICDGFDTVIPFKPNQKCDLCKGSKKFNGKKCWCCGGYGYYKSLGKIK
jgi:hypothetical protein